MRIVRDEDARRRRAGRREARGAVGVRRRHDPDREVRRARPAHRGAGPRRRHGHVVHLFERDCSTQRRHQKVLEEAPAPTITDPSARRVTSAAVALAREVGYTNAGTVEFLLDTDSDEVYFLEMNTRLQVEHPVTEAGDHRPRPRRAQLERRRRRAAAVHPGRRHLEGHAIEARVYAEDSFGGFLPQAGTAEPRALAAHRRVRVDHAPGESGQVVSTSYDPMLGKVIAARPRPRGARHALVEALDATGILGLTTNTGFLRALAASDEFRDATIDTAWLDHAELEATAEPEVAARLRRVVPVRALVAVRTGAPVPVRRLAARRERRRTPSGVELRPPRAARRPCRRAPVDEHEVREHRLGRPPRRGPQPSTAARDRRRQRPARTPPRSPTAGTAVRLRAPRRLRRPRPAAATAPSSRRCPAPCSTSAVTGASGRRG